MSDKSVDDGGPAFPAHGTMGEVVADGMTLRDYFAAKALPVITTPLPKGYTPDQLAKGCYAMADAMLKARQS